MNDKKERDAARRNWAENPEIALERAMEKIEQLEHDCMTLALRLMGEDESTLSPESSEVMKRWRPKAWKYLTDACKRAES